MTEIEKVDAIAECVRWANEAGRMEERAAIVAWLRKDDEVGVASVLADCIEYGDHMK